MYKNQRLLYYVKCYQHVRIDVYISSTAFNLGDECVMWDEWYIKYKNVNDDQWADYDFLISLAIMLL